MANTTQTQWIGTTEVAKHIRGILKKNFPGQKFSVRSQSYSGGSSINVDYTDGPSSDSVKDLIGHLHGCGFDGMIDLEYYHRHALLSDGSIVMIGTEGTTGSGGVRNAWRSEMPADAVEVSIGVSYLFVNRSLSEASRAALEVLVKGSLDCSTDWNVLPRNVHEIERKFDAKDFSKLKYFYAGDDSGRYGWGVI